MPPSMDGGCFRLQGTCGEVAAGFWRVGPGYKAGGYRSNGRRLFGGNIPGREADK